jgi:hypothetical protein
MSLAENKTKNRRWFIPILLTILFICSMVLNFMLMNQRQEEVLVIQHRTDTLRVEQNTLEENVKQKIAALEVFKGKNKILNGLIDEGTTKLSKLEEEAVTLRGEAKGSDQKKNELALKLVELDKTTKEFLAKINALIAQNKTLKGEKDSLSTGLANTNKDKSDLQEKVDIASVVKVEYLNVTTLKKKLLNKKMEPTSSAWLVSQIKSCFSIMPNPLAAQGSKVISLRITAPNGKVLVNTVSGSGTFKNEAGEAIQFTGSKTIKYTGTKLDQCIDYDAPPNSAFDAGIYQVEVYLDGVLTAKSEVKMK